MTLTCEDANSKLVEVVTLADVSDEDRVGNTLLQIWKLRLGQTLTLVQTLSTLVKILKLKFRRDFKLKFGQYSAADVWLRLRK